MISRWGKIRNIDLDNRIFEIETKHKLEYYYFGRSQYKRFKPYLHEGLYVYFFCKDELVKRSNKMTSEVISFTKMKRPTSKGFITYFDLETIKKGVNKLLSKDAYRMFIDLEFTMPSYSYVHGTGFKPEIIQYGIYLEDPSGNLVLTEHENVLPIKRSSITDRTLDFLNLKEKDFDHAQTYNQFYRTVQDIISMYQPVVYVWGYNDIYVMDLACEMHHKPKLLERKQIVNLMQVIKNYYSIKSDIGLFNAYSLFGKSAPLTQDHNSLSDAVTTSEIFHLFLDEVKHIKK